MYSSSQYNLYRTTRGNWGNFITTSSGQLLALRVAFGLGSRNNGPGTPCAIIGVHPFSSIAHLPTFMASRVPQPYADATWGQSPIKKRFNRRCFIGRISLADVGRMQRAYRSFLHCFNWSNTRCTNNILGLRKTALSRLMLVYDTSGFFCCVVRITL